MEEISSLKPVTNLKDRIKLGLDECVAVPMFSKKDLLGENGERGEWPRVPAYDVILAAGVRARGEQRTICCSGRRCWFARNVTSDVTLSPHHVA